MIAIAFYTRFKFLQNNYRIKQQPRRKRLFTAANKAAHLNTKMISLAFDDFVAFYINALLKNAR